VSASPLHPLYLYTWVLATDLVTMAAVFDCVLTSKDRALSHGATVKPVSLPTGSCLTDRVSPKLGGWNKAQSFPTTEGLVLKVNKVAI